MASSPSTTLGPERATAEPLAGLTGALRERALTTGFAVRPLGRRWLACASSRPSSSSAARSRADSSCSSSSRHSIRWLISFKLAIAPILVSGRGFSSKWELLMEPPSEGASGSLRVDGELRRLNSRRCSLAAAPAMGHARGAWASEASRSNGGLRRRFEPQSRRFGWSGASRSFSALFDAIARLSWSSEKGRCERQREGSSVSCRRHEEPWVVGVGLPPVLRNAISPWFDRLIACRFRARGLDAPMHDPALSLLSQSATSLSVGACAVSGSNSGA